MSIYGKEIGRVLVEGGEINLRASKTGDVCMIALRNGDEFETAAGRWSIARADEQGTLQNSMRPPPMPGCPPTPDLEPLKVTEYQEDPGAVADTNSSLGQDSEPAEDVPFSDDGEQEPAPPDQSPIAETNHADDDLDQHLGNILRSPAQPRTEVVRLTPTPSLGSEVSESPGEHSPPSKPPTVINLGGVHNPDPESSPRKRTLPEPDTKQKTKKRKKFSKPKEPVRFAEDEASAEVDETKVVESAVSSVGESSSPEKRPNRQGRSARKSPPASHSKLGSKPKVSETPQSSTPGPSTLESIRSRRSTSTLQTDSGEYDGTPVVFFASSTTIDEKKKTMRTFASLGGEVSKTIVGASVLCVGDVALKKTGSVLLAIAQGADIVSEDWIVQIHRTKRLLEPSNYLPKELDYEGEWGTTLAAAVARGKQGLKHLLNGMTVFLTTQFQQDFAGERLQSLRNVATAIGAVAVKTLPKRKPSLPAFAIGAVNDPEASQVGRLGLKLYDKELLTTAVLKGLLELEGSGSEILIQVKEEASQ